MVSNAVAERLRRAYSAPLEWAGVGSIPANCDAQNVPSFRRWRFEMKLSPFYTRYISGISKQVYFRYSPNSNVTGTELTHKVGKYHFLSKFSFF